MGSCPVLSTRNFSFYTRFSSEKWSLVGAEANAGAPTAAHVQTPGCRGQAGVGRGTRRRGPRPAPTPSAPMGTVPSAPRPRLGGFAAALASPTVSEEGRWILLTSKERRTESKQSRMPFKLAECGEGAGAAAGDDRTRQRPQGRSSRQLFARSSTEVGEQLGGTATSFSPFQPSHSRTPSIVPQCRGTAPRRSAAPAPHASPRRGSCSFQPRNRDNGQRLHEVAEGLRLELLPGIASGQGRAGGKPWLPTAAQRRRQRGAGCERGVSTAVNGEFPN